MTHVDLESVLIIKRRILGNQERLCELTEAWENSTSFFGGEVWKRAEDAIDMDLINSGSEDVREWRNPFEKFRLCVCQSRYWSQSNEYINSLLPLLILVWETPEHLGCALRVSNVGDLSDTSLLSDEIDLGWGIVSAHFSEAELPVGFILLSKSLVSWTMLGSSLISKPDIVTSVHELESGSNFWIVHDPAVCWVSDAMLQEDDWSAGLDFLWGDSEHVQDIAVLSSNWVRFKAESILCDNLLEGFIDIGTDLERVSFKIRLLNHQFIIGLLVHQTEEVHEKWSFHEEVVKKRLEELEVDPSGIDC